MKNQYELNIIQKKPKMNKMSKKFHYMRILKQDPQDFEGKKGLKVGM